MLVVVGGDAARRVVKGNVGDQVRVIAPRQHVASLYAAADLFLSASLSEGFSYSVGEAMAAGLPIVASDIPGVAWALGADGMFTFRNGDDEDLARVLRHVSTAGIEERLRWGSANKEFVQAHASLEAWYARVSSLYDRLLSKREAP